MDTVVSDLLWFTIHIFIYQWILLECLSLLSGYCSLRFTLIHICQSTHWQPITLVPIHFVIKLMDQCTHTLEFEHHHGWTQDYPQYYEFTLPCFTQTVVQRFIMPGKFQQNTMGSKLKHTGNLSVSFLSPRTHTDQRFTLTADQSCHWVINTVKPVLRDRSKDWKRWYLKTGGLLSSHRWITGKNALLEVWKSGLLTHVVLKRQVRLYHDLSSRWKIADVTDSHDWRWHAVTDQGY